MPDRLWWIADHSNTLPHLPDDLRGLVTAAIEPDRAKAIRTAARHSHDWSGDIVCVALAR